MRKTKCAQCGVYFTSTGQFDRHRIGPLNHRPSLRRCLTEDEMIRQGWSFSLYPITDETGHPIRKVYRKYPPSLNGAEIPAGTSYEAIGEEVPAL